MLLFPRPPDSVEQKVKRKHSEQLQILLAGLQPKQYSTMDKKQLIIINIEIGLFSFIKKEMILRNL